MQEKAEQGIYPSTAPIGYKNNRLTGMIDVDETKAPHIKRMFELMSTRNYSCEMLSQQLYKEGFRNKARIRNKDNAIAHYLRNPIYYGAFRWKGKLFQGSHTPIITKDLCSRVQTVLGGKTIVHTQQEDSFVFNNLLWCGVCGCKVIGEKKKKRYHYYHYTFSKGRHENRVYLREEKVADLIGETIRAIQLDDETVEWLKEALKEDGKSSGAHAEKRLASLRTEKEKIKTRLSRLYDAKFDNTLTEEIFIAKEKEYQGQLIEIKAGMDSVKRMNPNYYEDGCLTLKLCNRLYPLYVKANLAEKTHVVASNYTLVDVSLVPKKRRPFGECFERPLSPIWLPRLTDFRNWLQTSGEVDIIKLLFKTALPAHPTLGMK